MAGNSVKRIVVGVTGASGSIYGVRLLEALSRIGGIETHLIISHGARVTMAHETSTRPEALEKLANESHSPDNLAACVSSGSFKTDGMVVAPCSMKSLSMIAYSLGDNLLIRAADVMLKERRKLILLVRETPLHLGHLRQMTTVTEMGAVILPPVPSFYCNPQTIDDIVNQTIGKTLDQLGIDHDLFQRWSGK